MEKFAADVFHGLMSNPKSISSKYFYDKVGSRIYTGITNVHEYYPSKCESEILSTNCDKILKHINHYQKRFQLIELGSGDGRKTRILIKHFIEHDADFEYVPVDICSEENELLMNELQDLFPGLEVNSLTGDFMDTISLLPSDQGEGKVILFLGSTIGNMNDHETRLFLKTLQQQMDVNDLLLIGFDLKKHPGVISKAYNDSNGLTRAFNLNLLTRINTELDADFDISMFEHYPVYDPHTGEAKSYLVSSSNQSVFIKKLGKVFSFQEGEIIFTEVSRKFTVEDILDLAEHTGFEVIENFTDSRSYFIDSLWKKRA